VNKFIAILRRTAAVMAALALLSAVTPLPSRAQADAKPADAAPEVTAETGKKTKKVKAAKVKSAKPAKVAKVAKVAKPAQEKPVATAPAPSPKPAKQASKPKTPEKSLEEQKKDDGVYAKNSDWLAFKFGYAKRTGKVSGDGFVGYGVAYQHMMSSKFAFAAGVGSDVVGHFGQQIDIAVPFTAEFERHYKWKGAVRPYLGLGGGYYFRKAYRTGSEYTTTTTGGPHLSMGFTSALNEKHVIGFETRVARLRGRPGIVNPTFGAGDVTETLWTAKVSWALVY
jgi:hypothetical protein